jgi:hypothetical protein
VEVAMEAQHLALLNEVAQRDTFNKEKTCAG